MRQDIYNKPSEKTNREVKQLIIIANSIYVLAIIAFLLAIFGNSWGWLKISGFLAALGWVVHQILAKFWNWYLSG